MVPRTDLTKSASVISGPTKSLSRQSNSYKLYVKNLLKSQKLKPLQEQIKEVQEKLNTDEKHVVDQLDQLGQLKVK